MKKTTLAKLLAVACGFVAVSAFAQTSTTVTTRDGAAGTTVSETTTTTASGTFATYTPGSDYFTFESRGTTGAPVKYYYDRNTTVLDPEGRTVTWSSVRPSTPATVYYVREGDRMVVRKVVLTKAPTVIEKETTTTTTTTNEKEHH